MNLRIVTRQRTCRALRKQIRLPFRAVANFGLHNNAEFQRRLRLLRVPPGIIINIPEAVINGADKKRTKERLVEAGINTARWWPDANPSAEDFPVVAKHRFGSRGTGVYLLKTPAELTQFKASRNMGSYIVEKYRGYRYEYRVHASRTKAFLSHRKARKDGVESGDKWKYSYENSVWFTESNPKFCKPEQIWPKIVDACTKAIAVLGLDFGVIDVKVSNNQKKFLDRKSTRLNSSH